MSDIENLEKDVESSVTRTDGDEARTPDPVETKESTPEEPKKPSQDFRQNNGGHNRDQRGQQQNQGRYTPPQQPRTPEVKQTEPVVAAAATPPAPTQTKSVDSSTIGFEDYIRAKISRTEGYNGTMTISVEGVMDLLLTFPMARIEVSPAHHVSVLKHIETCKRTKKFAVISDAGRAKAIWAWKSSNGMK